MSQIVFDDSRWPILVVTYPPQTISLELPDHLAQWKRYAERRQPYCAVADLSRGTPLSALDRREIGDFINSNQELLQTYCVAASIVTSSALQRGVITAITWIVPFPSETKTHASVPEGLSWVFRRMADSTNAQIPNREPIGLRESVHPR